MKYQGGFDVFKESIRYMFEAPSLSDVLFVVLGIAFFVGFLIVIPYLWSRYKASMELKKGFFNLGESMGLTKEEVDLLWGCASLIREPIRILQAKVVFERCISRIVKEDESKMEKVVQIRRKLRFDSLPWFLPLSTTKDIDLYQTGFVSHENNAYSSAVWGKNELELHIALLDIPQKPIQPGERVKFSFLREDDGRYYFQGEVIRTYMNGARLVLVLPHTEELSKIQLRESLRWRVNIPARIHVYKGEGLHFLEEPEDTMEATVEDISPQGIRVCPSKLVDVKVKEKVYVYFELNSYPIRAIGTIKNVRGGLDRACLGIKFDNLSKVAEDHIKKFIMEEQRRLLRSYKMGKAKEGSFS